MKLLNFVLASLFIVYSIGTINAYKVGLLTVATAKYTRFIPDLVASAKKYFCPDQELTIFVFTDGTIEPAEHVVVLPHQHFGWPFSTLFRFLAYYKHYAALKDMDYLFACDADMCFVDTIYGHEVLSKLVGTLHPGYVGTKGTYERRSESRAYIAPHEGEYYFAGGFYGGSSEEFFLLLNEVLTNIKIDIENGIVAVWHDESYLNRYFVDHIPSLVLPRAYCARPFDKPQKLVALDKNHGELRK